jgi:tocopherol O-methyltransferase
VIIPRKPQCPEAVAAHYDRLDPFYREIWGEHIHHGYWLEGRESPAEAAEAMVELVATRLRLAGGQQVCDIGCGYGATAQRLATMHGVSVTGLTISAAQHAVAQRRVVSRGSLAFHLEDWVDNTLGSASFDRAYAIESTEHMEDKQRAFSQAFRVLRPGGYLIVCAWLASPAPAAWQVRHLLEPICQEGRLPGMGDEADYAEMLWGAGFTMLDCEDISRHVARTWWVCLRRAATRLIADDRYRRFLRNRGERDRIFALTMVRLLAAYRTGALRYCLLTARRPD